MDRTILLLAAGLHQAIMLTGVEGGTHYVPPSLFVIGFSLSFSFLPQIQERIMYP